MIHPDEVNRLGTVDITEAVNQGHSEASLRPFTPCLDNASKTLISEALISLWGKHDNCTPPGESGPT